MTDQDLQRRIDRLPEEKQEELEERMETIRKDHRERFYEEHYSDIENQMDDDIDELADFNVVVSGFLEQDQTDYTFIRTEPLFHQLEKNFDVLIASRSKGIAVLVEIERTLMNRMPSKMLDFEGKMAVIESNGVDELDVDDYFEKVIHATPEQIDYVLASQNMSPEEIRGEAETQGLNFVAWMLSSHGRTCRIHCYTMKEEKTAGFDGHADQDLTDYIDTELEAGVEQQDYINFTYSSSKFLKMKRMAIALVNRFQRQDNDSWDFEDWRRLFSEVEVDLSNYTEEEKRTLYENIIEYGLDCGIVGVEEKNGGMFQNQYRIKTNATRDQQKLIDEIERKMTEHRMGGDFEETVQREKREIVHEMYLEYTTEGTTLDDFT